MTDKQFIDSGVKAYQLGKRFAEKIRVGKRFFGSMRIGMKVYGLTYKDLNNDTHDWRYEFECFLIGYHGVLGDKQICVSMNTNLVSGFCDRWGNRI